MRIAALLAALLLAACAQAPLEPAPADTEFDLAGRLAARYGEESFTGSLAWRHGASTDEMLISTPLGQGVARIVRRDGVVTLTTAEPREYQATDAESLTEQVLGFRLPLAGLADWVRGRAAPSLEERGWRIEYQDRDAEGRPTRLRLTYPGIELKLVVSQWK